MTYSKFRWDEDCPIEIIEEKHLPGKHDQTTHGRGGGSGGGVVEYANTQSTTQDNIKIQEEISPHYKKWAESLTGNELQAVAAYADNSMAFNGPITKPQFYSSSPEMNAVRMDLDSALEKASTHADMIVYRGIGTDLAKQLRKDDEFVSKGFNSTTLNEITAAKQFSGVLDDGRRPVIKMKLPKGTKAAAINAVASVYRAEAEILVHRGLKMRIIDIYPKNRTIHHPNTGFDSPLDTMVYEVEVLP